MTLSSLNTTAVSVSQAGAGGPQGRPSGRNRGVKRGGGASGQAGTHEDELGSTQLDRSLSLFLFL